MLPFAVVSASGVLLDSLIELYFPGIDSGHRCIAWLCASALLACIVHWRSKARKRLPLYHCVVLCLPLFATSHSLKCHQRNQQPLNYLLTHDPESSEFEGQIIGSVKHSQADSSRLSGLTHSSTRFDLKVTKIRLGQKLIPVRGILKIVIFEEVEKLHSGCVIRISGKAKAFPEATNPGEIDRHDFAAKRGYSGQLQCKDGSFVTLLLQNKDLRFAIWNRLQSISSSGVHTYFHFLKPENAQFAAALALGHRELIPDNTRDQLITTGTAHLLSVSGLHLGLVMIHLHLLLGLCRVGLRVKLLTMILLSLLYCALTGLNAPVNRATIMVMNWVIANWIYRSNDAINSLALCGLVFLAWDCFLLFDIGVQLSFLAVGLLVSLNTRPHRDFTDQPLVKETSGNRAIAGGGAHPSNWLVCRIIQPLKASFFLSFYLFVFMTPFLWLHFKIIAPISIVTNVVLGPLVIVSLFLSLILPFASMIHVGVANLLSIPCNISLDLVRWIIELSSTIEYGHFWLPQPPSISVAIFYCVLSSTFLGGLSRCRNWIQLFLVVFWYGIHLSLLFMPSQKSRFIDFVFLNVGHGTSVIIQDVNEETWLYDCGSLGQSRTASRITSNALWELGIRKIKGVFISHADSDHYNGIEAILSRFQVEQIYTTSTTQTLPTANLRRLFRTAQSLGVGVATVDSSSDPLPIGECTNILHPQPRIHYESDNASSLVLDIRFSGQSVILPGDIDGEGIQDLIRTPLGLNRGFVMAPHHGRFSEETESFLDWSLPSCCLISGSSDVSRTEVADLLKDRQIAILSTAAHHALRIRLYSDNEKAIHHWHENKWQAIAVLRE
ncbi:MAG: ComEC/Rec2 family competence protein [Rubripirellula sp.]|nr:ComEC/Rec2 family competence protein [Rubripirellula sp.]